MSTTDRVHFPVGANHIKSASAISFCVGTKSRHDLPPLFVSAVSWLRFSALIQSLTLDLLGFPSPNRRQISTQAEWKGYSLGLAWHVGSFPVRLGQAHAKRRAINS